MWDPILKKFGHLPDWEHETLSVIRTNRAGFLHNDEVYNEWFVNAHPTLKAWTLWHASQPGWVFQLTLMFEMAQLCADLIANFTRSLHLGLLGYEACIRAQEEMREQEVTYERFMEILGAPTDVTRVE